MWTATPPPRYLDAKFVADTCYPDGSILPYGMPVSPPCRLCSGCDTCTCDWGQLLADFPTVFCSYNVAYHPEVRSYVTESEN